MRHAVLWVSGSGAIQDLGTLPDGTSSRALAINNRREPTRRPAIASARGPPHEDFDRYEGDAFASIDPLPLYDVDRRVSW